jgi:nitrate/TMAO reductase-like tetraheme cytochrome c subunit
MKTKLLWILPVMAVVVLAFGIGVWGTSQPGMCNSCHEMQGNVASWTKSGHLKVNCEECHIKPGFTNTIVRKAQALGEVTAHFTGSYTVPINKDSHVSRLIPAENCLSCHKTPEKEVFGSVRFPHNEHNKTNCAYCHNRVAHRMGESYNNRLEMDSCIECHKNKNESVSCKTCHPSGVVERPSSHRNGNWIATHKASAGIRCSTGCHNSTFCTDCHTGAKSKPASHKVTNWVGTHKKVANAKCATTCHTASFCDKCHVINKVKPQSHRAANWVPSIHKKVATASCSKTCHNPTFCTSCHKPASHAAASWARNHEGAVNVSCTASCHAKVFCNNCHAKNGERD